MALKRDIYVQKLKFKLEMYIYEIRFTRWMFIDDGISVLEPPLVDWITNLLTIADFIWRKNWQRIRNYIVITVPQWMGRSSRETTIKNRLLGLCIVKTPISEIIQEMPFLFYPSNIFCAVWSHHQRVFLDRLEIILLLYTFSPYRLIVGKFVEQS